MFKKIKTKIDEKRETSSFFWRFAINGKDWMWRTCWAAPSRISRRYFYFYKGYCLDLKRLRLRRLYPNLFIIGAAKAGTTSLNNYLNKHPEIFMSPIKEPCIFVHRNKRKKWGYNTQLYSSSDNFLLKKTLMGHNGQRLVGDSSHAYTSAPTTGTDIPKKIKKNSPQSRFIYILRNPLDRIVSSYLQLIKEREFKGSFDEFLEHTCALMPSFYYYQLSNFLRYFPKDRFKVIIFEEFVKNPKKEMQEIFKFLKVDPSIYDHSSKLEVFNKSFNKKEFSKNDLKFPLKKYERLAPLLRKDIASMEKLLSRSLSIWDLSRKRWVRK